MERLLNMMPDEIITWMKNRGEPSFRGRQLMQALYQGQEIDEITTLSKPLRASIMECAVTGGVLIHQKHRSRDGETQKFLFLLDDGHMVEGVLMGYRHGRTLCVSSQVGCRMGCQFCASTLAGLERQLRPGEMVGQVVVVNRLLRERGEAPVNHVVIMGSGEPFDNYGHVVTFLRLLTHEATLHMSCRNISLSTCGLTPAIRDFIDEELPVTLCISLHAPNDALRVQLMPVAKAHPLPALMSVCREYVQITGRRVIFEYALIDGINDAPEQAEQLAVLLRGFQCHVNLIPLNDVAERGYRASPPQRIQAFMDTLNSRHISATRRREMGSDIAGACGQLRNQTLNGVHK